jgi:hypothetical protein
MTSEQRFEHELPDLLADLYMRPAPDYRHDVVQRAVRTRQRPAWTFPERWLPMTGIAQGRLRPQPLRGTPGLLAAATVLLAALLGGAALAGAFGPSVPSPSPTPSPSSPSPTQALAWNQASLERDWPAPVREEPIGGSAVVPHDQAEPSFTDPRDDIGPGAPAWVDIREMTITANTPDAPGAGGVDLIVRTKYAAAVPTPQPDPSEQWIAYGLVLDTNEDGVPDVRLGIDNAPKSEEPEHRAWRTDLDTGTTVAAVGAPYGFVGNTYFDTFYPGEQEGAAAARLGVDMPDGSTYRFYGWASVIVDGRVVATDYAPDSGWLDPWP